MPLQLTRCKRRHGRWRQIYLSGSEILPFVSWLGKAFKSRVCRLSHLPLRKTVQLSRGILQSACTKASEPTHFSTFCLVQGCLLVKTSSPTRPHPHPLHRSSTHRHRPPVFIRLWLRGGNSSQTPTPRYLKSCCLFFS